jgi:hypothetical protein
MSYLTDIERLNYYEGEFLGAVDFQAEQEYHRDMRRRHNLGQHTWGIVTGLQLAQAPNGYMDGSLTEVDVFLQPGMAVDGFGREIVVLNQYQLTTAMFAAVVPEGPGAVQQMSIWIGYQEALLQPPSDACANMNVSNAYARIQETYTLIVTAAGNLPVNSAIVVNGNTTTAPVEPSPSVPLTPPAPAPTPTDPPQITLPYDDSIPYQEFSTDDTNLTWWLPLGQVTWDPSTGVFVQTSASIACLYREYAGNVSAQAYAPAGAYRISDRNSSYPPPSGTDPNLGGVKAEVAGSLQVDFLLNAEMNVLIGSLYSPNSTPDLSPLTITASNSNTTTNKTYIANQELMQFRDSSNNETWHISQMVNNNAGLNFGQIVSGSPSDGVLFLANGGSVGVGTTSPSQNLSVNKGINLDQLGLNAGKLDPGLTFGNTDQAGISSNQSGGGTNPSGLDFYTSSVPRVSITNSGYVGIGTSSPERPLAIQAQGNGQELISFKDSTGATKWHLNQNLSGTANGLNFAETGVADGRLFLQAGGNVGIRTTSPLAPLHVAAASGLANPNLPVALIESNSSPGPSPRLGLVDTWQGTNTSAPVWFIDNDKDSFRIFRQTNYTTGGTAFLQIDNSGVVTISNGLHVLSGPKSGYVADRFVNRDGVKLERGDVLVLHAGATAQSCGVGGRIPLAEVQLTEAAFDTRVCGIVDESVLPDSQIADLDRKKIGSAQVGLMVTLGAYAFCKVDADIAPISPGDLLITSPTRGHAQKLEPSANVWPGGIIGKALGSLASGKGMIPILVSHQ